MSAKNSTQALHVAWYIHPLRMGGLEHFLLRLANRLDPNRVRITALFARRGEVAEIFAAKGIPTQVLGFRSFKRGFRKLSEALGALNVDAVQTNLFTPLVAIAAGQSGIPHLWRVGGHPDVALRRLPPEERRAQLEILALQSAAIVCNSDYVASALEGLPGPAPIVIRNGIELGTAESVRATGRAPQRAPRVCMLAHFDPQKRHEDLIRAAALVKQRVPKTRFALFGSTFGEPSMVAYRRGLRSLIQSLGLSDTVIMRRTNDAEAELRRSSVSIMPSIGESSSNAILESAACGTPVIAADSGGNSEMIESGVDGILVKPRSPESLAAAILQVIEDSTLAQRLADGAGRRLKEVHDIDESARQYEKFYRDCLLVASSDRPNSGPPMSALRNAASRR